MGISESAGTLSSKLELDKIAVVVACPSGSRSFARFDSYVAEWVRAGLLVIVAVAENAAEALLLSTELHDDFELVFDANGTGPFSTIKAGLEGLQGRGAAGSWLILLDDLEMGRVPSRFWVNSTDRAPSGPGATWLDRDAIRRLVHRPATASWPE